VPAAGLLDRPYWRFRPYRGQVLGRSLHIPPGAADQDRLRLIRE
jgi:hypothetical protein